MSARAKTKELNAGEFYGNVPKKRQISSSVISEVIHPKEVDLPKHSHKLGFFGLIVKGFYSENFGNKSFLHQPMTVFWRPAGISHKDKIEKDGLTFFCAEINQEYLEKLRQYTKIPVGFEERNTSLVNLANRLRYEFKDWQNCSPLVAEGIILEMLGYAAKKNPLEKSPPKWLFTVIERLNDEFVETPTTEELALEVDVHPVHLAAVFRKFQNQTIGEYIQNLRIKRASELLSNEETPLSEIALSTGFSDQSHFTRIFKRITGTTPGAFRKKLD